MKSILIILVFTFGFVAANAQVTGSGKKVAQSAVPSTVISAWRGAFPGASVASWNQLELNGQLAYTAIFVQNGKSTRARFGSEAKHRWTSVYHTPAQTPGELANAARAAHAGYTLRWARMNTDVIKGFTYYKVRLGRGASTITSYFGQDMQPLSQAQINSNVSADLESATNDNQ